jgi:hypothetical protein
MLTWEEIAVCDDCAGRIQWQVWERGRWGVVFRLMRRWVQGRGLSHDLLRAIPPAVVLSLVAAPIVEAGLARLPGTVLRWVLLAGCTLIAAAILVLVPYLAPSRSVVGHGLVALTWVISGGVLGSQFGHAGTLTGAIIAALFWGLVTAVGPTSSQHEST